MKIEERAMRSKMRRRRVKFLQEIGQMCDNCQPVCLLFANWPDCASSTSATWNTQYLPKGCDEVIYMCMYEERDKRRQSQKKMKITIIRRKMVLFMQEIVRKVRQPVHSLPGKLRLLKWEVTKVILVVWWGSKVLNLLLNIQIQWNI